jgi:hypothetical protein
MKTQCSSVQQKKCWEKLDSVVFKKSFFVIHSRLSAEQFFRVLSVSANLLFSRWNTDGPKWHKGICEKREAVSETGKALEAEEMCSQFYTVEN